MQNEDSQVFAGHVGASEENRVVKRSFGLERLATFSDGVFAIAITLLALALPIPEIKAAAVEVESLELWNELRKNSGLFLSFAISFYVVGAFWVAHHRYFRWIARYDRALVVRNLLLLFFISLLPFSSELVGKYSETALAIVFYALNIAAVGACDLALWVHAARGNRLLMPDFDARLKRYVAVRALSKPLAALIVVALATMFGSWSHLGWFFIFIVLWIAETRFLPR